MPVRLGSVRTRRKNLRPFGDTTLFEHALRFRKSRSLSRLYVAAYEPEFEEILERYPDVVFIKRSRRSAEGEDLESIYDFLGDIEEDYLATINTCLPFLRLETFDAAIEYYRGHLFPTMVGACEAPGWYFTGDTHRLVNAGAEGVINSKNLMPLLKSSPAVLCWHRRRVMEEKRFWTMAADDPHLYLLPPEECIDIDTELEFEIAEALFVHRQRTGRLQL